MFIRKLALLAAISALGLMSVGAATSSATSFLREGPSNALTANGSRLTNGGSDPAVLTLTGLGTITCTAIDLDLTLHLNSVSVITATLDTLTFTTCHDTIPVISITSCGAVAPLPTASLVGTGASTGTVTLTDTTVFCHVTGGTSGCYYTAATAAGNASASTVTYDNVGVTHTTGTGDLGSLCGSNATFSLTLTDLKNAANNTTVKLGNT